jgi:hypothetical protein
LKFFVLLIKCLIEITNEASIKDAYYTKKKKNVIKNENKCFQCNCVLLYATMMKFRDLSSDPFVRPFDRNPITSNQCSRTVRARGKKQVYQDGDIIGETVFFLNNNSNYC